MTCTTCGRENPPHLTFCQECGQRLGPRIAPPTPPIGLGRDSAPERNFYEANPHRPAPSGSGPAASPVGVEPGPSHARPSSTGPSNSPLGPRASLAATVNDPSERPCRICATPNGPGLRYCTSCGSTLEPVTVSSSPHAAYGPYPGSLRSPRGAGLTRADLTDARRRSRRWGTRDRRSAARVRPMSRCDRRRRAVL